MRHIAIVFRVPGYAFMTGAIHLVLIIGAVWSTTCRAEGGDGIPSELRTPNYRITKLSGIGYDKDLNRQDPSNVIKVGDRYYVWYTQRKRRGVHPYAATVYYATSKDGLTWDDQGQALGKGRAGEWDSFGVITPYVAVYDGKYYLYYTGTSPKGDFKSRGPDGTLRHIGVAIADSPDGPWKKFDRNPILSPDEDNHWENLLVDDAHVIRRNGKFWFYYKGGHQTVKTCDTQWGLAIGDRPTGPFIRHNANPLIGGHTVCVWPHREGIAGLIDSAGSEAHTVQWSADGLHFQRAAKVDRVLTGCGPYDPDAFTNTDYGDGIRWGVAQYREKGTLCIVRFDVDCKVPPDTDKQATPMSNKKLDGSAKTGRP